MNTIPTQIFVVKIASRCNLACAYCYMYEHPDQTWRFQPKFINIDTVKKLARRIEEYSKNQFLGEIMIVIHGGEPLLYKDLDLFFNEFEKIKTNSRILYSIQTNGILFNQSNLKVLNKYNVKIGISIDGTESYHNKFRVDKIGKGSYADVIAGLNIVKESFPSLLSSILQVINPNHGAKDTLDHLEGLGLPRADFLFPDYNHSTLSDSGLKKGDIGNWLIDVFDEWKIREKTIDLRIFKTIIGLLIGNCVGTDQFGETAIGALMIETDGTYEIYDGLKTAYEGAGKTYRSVFNTSISEIEEIKLVMSYRDKKVGACDICLNCKYFSVCGGGNLIHRYDSETKFDNPSVYCDDLQLIINHIDNFIQQNSSKKTVLID